MRIGVDFGGTKIEGIALAPDGRELYRRRVATPREYEGSLQAVAALVSKIEDAVGERGTVGIGIPGAESPGTDLIKNANSTWLIGRPLRRDLEACLRRPVRLMNDANCFALSEAADGAAAGARVVFGVILGTGVGGGIVVDGECLVGPNRIAGEWGHNPLPWLRAEEHVGPECYCGARGCIETYLSGPGLERDHHARSGQRLSSRQVLARAEEGDAVAAESLAIYHDRLGRALASVINVFDPDVVVLGGGMSNLPDLPAAARAAASPYVFSDTLETTLVRHHHGDSSGVRGAAWLWPLETSRQEAR
jgi:fructokinase